MLAYPALARPLHDAEREARDMKLNAGVRLALREAKSVPILDDIKVYLQGEHPRGLPKSPEVQGVYYTLSICKRTGEFM